MGPEVMTLFNHLFVFATVDSSITNLGDETVAKQHINI